MVEAAHATYADAPLEAMGVVVMAVAVSGVVSLSASRPLPPVQAVAVTAKSDFYYNLRLFSHYLYLSLCSNRSFYLFLIHIYSFGCLEHGFQFFIY